MDPASRAAVLIRELNNPAQAVNAQSISQELQSLQLSTDGWHIADTLIGSADATLQFYGALTFQIKLNREASSLDSDGADAVLERLLVHFTETSSRGGTDRILDKICSALATFILQAPQSWPNALMDTMMCFLNGTARHKNDQTADPISTIERLSTSQLLSIVRLSRIMSEDLSSLEGNTQKQSVTAMRSLVLI